MVGSSHAQRTSRLQLLVGGGFVIANGDIEIYENHPTFDGRGWYVRGFNRLVLPGSNPLQAYAACAFSN